jgi:hypothetical protein
VPVSGLARAFRPVTFRPVFDPTHLSNLFGFYHARDFYDLGIADSAAVGTWGTRASAPAAGNLTQGTAGKRPLYRDGSSVGINGHPCVAFDGSDDALVTAAFTAEAVMTYFLVAQTGSSVAAQRALLGSPASGGDVWPLYHIAGGGLRQYAGSALVAGNVAASTNYFFTSVKNGASSLVRISGSESTGNSGSNTMVRITLGASNGGGANFFNGLAGLLIAYNRALSAAEILLLEAWGRSEFGL